MNHTFWSYLAQMRLGRAALIFATAIAALFSTEQSACVIAPQRSNTIAPMSFRFHPISGSGKHVRRRIVGLVGESRPVALDIIQGKQEGTNSDAWVWPQVCIVGARPKSCFVPHTDIAFFIVVQAKPMEIAPGKRVLLLQTGTYAGDEPSILTQFVVIGRNGKLTDLLPGVVTGVLQEEVSFWRDIALSPYIIVTQATALFPESDASFFGRHTYMIAAYTYCPELGRYTEAIYFNLVKKIPGLDLRHSKNFLLSKVSPGIKRRLLQRKRPCTARAETTCY